MDIPLDEVERWLIEPVLGVIRFFDIPIPPLQDHWQQVFVLTWLVSAAFARAASRALPTSLTLCLAFVTTLPFCIVSGTVSVVNEFVDIWHFWPVVGFLIYISILYYLTRDSHAAFLGLMLAAAAVFVALSAGSWVGTASAIVPAFVIVAIFLIVVARRLITAMEEEDWATVLICLMCLLVIFLMYAIAQKVVGAGTLASLAFFVFVWGVMFLMIGVLFGGSKTLWLRLSEPITTIGLDITAAMGLALGIAVLAADPPILALF
jgi:hypothetical protein